MGVLCGAGGLWDRFSDRCSRFFPCLTDPARRHALSLKLTLVMLHLVVVGILFIFDKDLIEETREDPWYTTSYVLLFFATLAQYFVTCGTSPGYVLDKQHATDERDAIARRMSPDPNKDNQLQGNDSSVFITVDQKNNYNENPTAWTRLVMDLYTARISTRNLTCQFCNIIQPPRAKHCHDCDKCVLQFDHHCVWLGTCIGQGNHCRFWWYICEETVLCLWTCILYITYLKSNISKAWYADVIMILLLATLLMSLFFLLLLLLFHSYLVVTNQTTYELVRRRRIGYLRGIPERVYPFSKGACRNLQLFCCGQSNGLEALPSAQEIERKSRPYTCLDVLSCRCC